MHQLNGTSSRPVKNRWANCRPALSGTMAGRNHPSMTNPKILICDDEEGIRESLKLVLGDHYPLAAVDSGEMALKILSHSKDIQVMLLDIKMPKNNGLDVLQEVKKKFPRVKIIMVTGYKSVETAAEATRLGASGYIVKPFKSQEVLETVKRNLD